MQLVTIVENKKGIPAQIYIKILYPNTKEPFKMNLYNSEYSSFELFLVYYKISSTYRITLLTIKYSVWFVSTTRNYSTDKYLVFRPMFLIYEYLNNSILHPLI